MRRHLVLNCEGDLHIFPFDSPMCDFNIESIFHTADKMRFMWWGRNAVPLGQPSGTIGLSPVLKYHNAYMIHNETLYCSQEEEWRGNYSCLKVDTPLHLPLLIFHHLLLRQLILLHLLPLHLFSHLPLPRQVRLHFTRDKGFYYTTVFAPGLVLVMSSFFTFWIEWDATPAR